MVSKLTDSKKLHRDFALIAVFKRFSCSGTQIVILTMPCSSEVSSYLWKQSTDVWYDQNFCLNIFLKKITSENQPFLGFFEPLTNECRASLFGKTEYFSFFIDKILLKRRMTILKLGIDSPEPGEHFTYPESMSGVPRKDFLINFQKSYFFE